MSHKALYRKWRPAVFSDVCGQDHIVSALKYQVANNAVSHAYLFCGSRGTGKTTCAKILAKAVNCLSPVNGEPCGKCDACRSIDSGSAVDVIEMDAASNNSVDDIRTIRDDSSFSPSELRYRVYIVDEVHMLSKSAFNALLKTLEEPPEYLIFILATTELNQIPATVVSRCQRFDFSKIAPDVISGRLKKIAEAEGAELTDDGAVLIARLADGGMRDAIGLLEMCLAGSRKIDSNTVTSVFGLCPSDVISGIVTAVTSKDYAGIFSAVARAEDSSLNILSLWQSLMEWYRNIIVLKTVSDTTGILYLSDYDMQLLKKNAGMLDLPSAVYQAGLLDSAFMTMKKGVASVRSIAELTLIKMTEPSLSNEYASLYARVSAMESRLERISFASAVSSQPPQREQEHEAVDIAAKAAEDPAEASPLKEEQDAAEIITEEPSWKQELIEKLSETAAGIVAYLRGSLISENGGKIRISVKNRVFETVLKRKDNTELLAGAISSCAGRNVSPSDIDIAVAAQKTEKSDADELFGRLGG